LRRRAPRRPLQLAAVYGNQHHRGTDESAPYRYGDTYTDAKIDSERAVLEFAELGEVESVSLRPGFGTARATACCCRSYSKR